MSEIYALTDDFYTPNLEACVKTILDCGIKMVQFRSKKDSINEKEIINLVKICDSYSANLIVNDSITLAKRVGAHGVHIGLGDGEVKEAREILGADKIVGVSCYGSLDLALKASDDGASYAAFGSAFPTKTKKDAKVFKLRKFKEFKDILSIKTCIIGGINASNLEQILALRPDYIALVSAVYTPNSISENLRNLQKIIRDFYGHY